jgi:hypothetical protein
MGIIMTPMMIDAERALNVPSSSPGIAFSSGVT